MAEIHNSSYSRVGWVEHDGEVKGNSSRTGWVESNGDIFDSRHSRVGWVKNGTVYSDPRGDKVGYVSDSDLRTLAAAALLLLLS